MLTYAEGGGREPGDEIQSQQACGSHRGRWERRVHDPGSALRARDRWQRGQARGTCRRLLLGSILPLQVAHPLARPKLVPAVRDACAVHLPSGPDHLLHPGRLFCHLLLRLRPHLHGLADGRVHHRVHYAARLQPGRGRGCHGGPCPPVPRAVLRVAEGTGSQHQIVPPVAVDGRLPGRYHHAARHLPLRRVLPADREHHLHRPRPHGALHGLHRDARPAHAFLRACGAALARGLSAFHCHAANVLRPGLHGDLAVCSQGEHHHAGRLPARPHGPVPQQASEPASVP
mmetsp:Transcript_144700/g.252231  ORF Transcript_144700/g.252231 Transcript_144700/m.252231 type:complete len:287 (+) Transcript_144700:1547-2407(+)